MGYFDLIIKYEIIKTKINPNIVGINGKLKKSEKIKFWRYIKQVSKNIYMKTVNGYY